MMKRCVVVLALLSAAATLSPNTLKANDSTAELGAGGLIFSKNDDVDMTSEDLFVSREQIIVDYKFYNRSSHDVTSLVAFPLPEIEYQADADVGIPSPDSVNFVDFVTLVEGRRIEADVELKSNVQGVDKTEELKRLGMPLNPYQASSVINAASKSVLDEMRREDLLDENNQPLWKLKTVFYWQQTFPKGRTVEISHRYRPIAGGSVMTSIHHIPTNTDIREDYKKYCVERSLIDAVNRSIKPGEDYPRFGELNVEYILTTGANWASPIRRFRLVVDKGSPRNLVSFCGDGVTKISPTRFEITATDFVPKQNLEVLILTPGDDTEGRETDVAERRDFGSFTCADLWQARNAIFKAEGYCFKTSRAISQFGNSGCKYDDIKQVPLSDAERNEIGSIKNAERLKHCPR